MKEAAVGIVANPASGKDIRRIVTYSSPYDNQEKVNIIRRVIMALHATGVRKIYYMPEYYNIVPQALNGMYEMHKKIVADMEYIPLDFFWQEKESDSTKAGELLHELGVGCILTLGGDGTNRAVALGCKDTPIVPVSTGTNNVFPSMIEGTLAGLAAGVVAMGVCDNDPEVFEKRKRIDLYVDGEHKDLALIDMVVLDANHIGARAMWKADGLTQLFVTQCCPYYIGISSIPGQLNTITPTEPHGMAIEVGKEGDEGQIVRAAIAPGTVSPIVVKSSKVMEAGESFEVKLSPCIVAVDGERNTEIRPGQKGVAKLNLDGPVVVNMEKALEYAAKKKYFLD